MTYSYDVVMVAHNEERYIKHSILSIARQEPPPKSFIVVLDRCSDDTPRIVEGLSANLPIQIRIISRGECSWRNCKAENLEISRRYISSEYFAIVDADVILKRKYFSILMDNLSSHVGIVSGDIISFWDSIYGSIYYAWDRFSRKIRFPTQSYIRGCAMLIRTKLIDAIGGFIDELAEDTYIQIRIRELGYMIKLVPYVKAYHIREMNLDKIFSKQYLSGIARASLGISLGKTILHSLIRLRPLVLSGYLKTCFIE